MRMPLDKAFLLTVVSLDPGVVNWYCQGIYALVCHVHLQVAGHSRGK